MSDSWFNERQTFYHNYEEYSITNEEILRKIIREEVTNVVREEIRNAERASYFRKQKREDDFRLDTEGW